MTTRQQLIADLVKKYKTDYREEYKAVCKIVKDKRAKLKDKKTAMIGGFMRPNLYFPQILFNWIDFAIDNPRFGEDTKELVWFGRKFPEFRLPQNL